MTSFQSAAPNISNALLDHMHYRADPLADETIAKILGNWLPPTADSEMVAINSAKESVPPVAPKEVASEYGAQWELQWQKLATVSQIFEDWSDNHSLIGWTGQGDGTTAIPPEIAEPLCAYVQAAKALPPWADVNKIARAEELFMDYGALSVTLLFCSSLPECYVVPDLAAVLHATGQLEKHAEHRIRSTGAMIFPVMMRGGMTTPNGGGVAQIFKVRLIHATIRNLILRGTPERAVEALGDAQKVREAGVTPPLLSLEAAQSMHQVLFAHGWKLGKDGLPCNQEELAYTLLTFSYVFLRSMRKLGIGLPAQDEEAYLHAWNVMGYFLGIERELMPETMAEAEALFALMQARGRQNQLDDEQARLNELKVNGKPNEPGVEHEQDPRPALGTALMNAMKQVIPLRLLKPFPVMMTRFLCGPATAKDLGLTGWISLVSRFLFAGFMIAVRVIDILGRLVFPGFSIARFITRVLGYRFMSKLLMDQTRPLKLPESVKNRVKTMMVIWSEAPQEPAWVKSIENRLTGKTGDDNKKAVKTVNVN